jgi:uncharacterized protein YqiB (DUF1249 family)|tara:strand:+ start:48672 stop:49034 length:363 start_codon:yes stop_codon:yes gene_type:complete
MRLTLKTLIYAGLEDQLRIEIEVLDRAPYTTHLFVRGEVSGLPWAGEMEMDVQMYHDARMAEVSRYSSQKLVFIRNRYPNAQMFQRHEKWHANQFLGVWLDHFIQSGYEYMLPSGSTRND